MSISKIAMFIKGYDKVVSRLPIFVQQNINARAPWKFMGRLEVEIIKDKRIKVIPQLITFWDKHIILRMTVALKKVLKERMETQCKSKRLTLRRGKQ